MDTFSNLEKIVQLSVGKFENSKQLLKIMEAEHQGLGAEVQEIKLLRNVLK